MSRSTQWLSLVAGICLLLVGIAKLYMVGEWVLLVLAALIIAFTLTSMSKSRQKE
ncbi:MAG: hypothetical protein MUF52_09875 [Syntrophobacteraceae bacterium]|nr:hypothetical protein [Syntrophobacteraceae bacterium]